MDICIILVYYHITIHMSFAICIIEKNTKIVMFVSLCYIKMYVLCVFVCVFVCVCFALLSNIWYICITITYNYMQ